MGPGEEVGSKLVRLFAFVGAGVICTSAINLWRDFERKRAAEKMAEEQLSNMVNKTVD